MKRNLISKPPTRHSARRRSRRSATRGSAELVEFALNFLPLMVMAVFLVSISWAVFAQATLQQAVRMAARRGVTYTTHTINGNLTDAVKKEVQDRALGLLNGGTGLSYIKVHYFDQDDPSLDVSNTVSGNRGGNIMQVSVEGYALSPLMARFFKSGDTPNAGPTSINVFAADVIEPLASNLTPPIGPAP